MMLRTVQPVHEEHEMGWKTHEVGVWTVGPDTVSRARRTKLKNRTSDNHHDDDLGTVESFFDDFEDLDIREFDGDEPEMADLVLAGEESDVMNLDASQTGVI